VVWAVGTGKESGWEGASEGGMELLVQSSLHLQNAFCKLERIRDQGGFRDDVDERGQTPEAELKLELELEL